MKLTGICLITKDVPALAKFYQTILNVPGEGDDTHIDFVTDGAGLAIFSEEGMEGMAPGSMKGAGCGNTCLMLEVQDVDGEYLRMKALGVSFVKLPETHPWGARSFWFRDPDGNIVDFYGRV